MINLISPQAPKVNEIIKGYKKILKKGIFTNNGPLAKKLEKELSSYIGVNCAIVNSGMSGLISTLNYYNLSGEIVTTPYTYIATSHSIVLSGLTPVFAHPKKQDFNIDPESVKRCINEKTSAILAVHAYGNGNYSDLDKLQKIANEFKIKLIYDAAQSFGVNLKNKSILNYGNASIVSFHATKVLSSIEGGAVFSHDMKLISRIKEFRQFGISDAGKINSTGSNCRMSEIHALFGLLNLKKISQTLKKRRKIFLIYQLAISKLKNFSSLKIEKNSEYNGAYFPIVLENTLSGKAEILVNWLAKRGVMSKRYFYPIVTDLNLFSKMSKDYSKLSEIFYNVVCLPIHCNLTNQNQKKIIYLLKKFSDEFCNK